MAKTAQKTAEVTIPPGLTNAGPGEVPLYFTNNGLFSDTYLLHHLPSNTDPIILENWDTDDLPEFSAAYEWMLSNWEKLRDILPTLNEAQLEERWVRPILKLLGWEYEVQDRLKKRGKTQVPDYSLFDSFETYKKAREAKTDEGYFSNVLAVADAKAWDVNLDGTSHSNSNPSYQITRYLEDTRKTWGILTDGRYWRLYSTRSESRYTTYYEVNIEKLLAKRDDDRFKYFINFFRKGAFVVNATSGQNFLDIAFDGGEQYAKGVEKNLRVRAFRMVECFCRGFSGNAKVAEADLRKSYEHSLYYLFRLMFILNCEAKGLLNVNKQADYFVYSLRSLCVRLKEEFEAGRTWSNQPRSYNYIKDLFSLIEQGDEKIGIHGFGKDIFTAGDQAFYSKNVIPDAILNPVLIELALSYDDEGSLKFIDYKRLSPDHLGSLFEGLLEFHLTYATERLVRVGDKVLRWIDLSPKKQEKLKESAINIGDLYLENTSEERKNSGSFYTPMHIVNYIVKDCLSGLIKDKSSEEILKLRCIDPAMGSGPFLLGAVAYLESELLERMSKEERDSSVLDPYEIRWRVLHSCIYGVDLNPLAVELAKFSLWMFSARKGHKLEPLNDQLVCGDSLSQDPWKTSFTSIMKSGGFDAVVGNPPYVRQETLAGYKAFLRDNYEVFDNTADLYTYFIEKGIAVLKSGGNFGIIVSNKWMRAKYGAPLRKWLKQRKIECIIDFGDVPVFEGATTYPCILRLAKSSPAKTFSVVQIKTPEFQPLHSYTETNSYTVTQNDLDDAGWSLVDDRAKRLMSRLHAVGAPLKEYVDQRIFYGIKTGLNEAFVIDEKVKNEILGADKNSGKLIKPFLAGRDLQRFSTPDIGRHIILIPSGWTSEQSGGKGDAWQWLTKNYPGISKHLSQFEKDARKRCDKGEYWWELRSCDYYDEFVKAKIVVPAIQKRGFFCLDGRGRYSNDKTTLIGSDELYLVGVLNSKVSDFVIHSISSTKRGGYFEYKPMYMEKIPIPSPGGGRGANQKKKIEEATEKLIALYAKYNKAEPDRSGVLQAAIIQAEESLNEEVYKLFGLTDEEIGIIELVVPDIDFKSISDTEETEAA